MKKVVQQFASLSDSYQALAKEQKTELPSALVHSEPRISRGEQYHELPWVMLDYPRIFGREEIFAIRTMFWWGHDYSMTLHLRGNYLTRFKPAIERALLDGKLKGFLLSGVPDEWMHHRDDHSHHAVEGMDAERLRTMLEEKPFIKLRCGFPITTWVDTEASLLTAFRMLIQVFLGVSSQGGERVP